MFENIVLEDQPLGIKILKISRPQALNSLNTKTLEELRTALRAIALDHSVRVLILTGAGEKAFIAGADISEMQGKGTGEGVAFSRLGQEVTKLLEHAPMPVIAAVQGYALGGGTEMALACDFILASEKAVFGQPEVGLGIIPGWGGTIRLARFVGLARAKELIFSGRKVNASEALTLGLVNRVIPASGFLEEVIKIAQEISRSGSRAVRGAKRLMQEFNFKSVDGALDAEAMEFGSLFGSKDQVEGMTAFVEKRKPKFEGLESVK